MICSCSRLATGCTVPTRVTFAPGHNGRSRGLLVAALVSGDLVSFDGALVDPWVAAEALGLTLVVRQFLDKHNAAAAVRAARAAEAQADSDRRVADRSYAREVRARRVAARSEARLLAEAARDRLIAAAVAARDESWPDESWRDLPLA